ncbi:MAG TPA: helix-turn-helix domain-containing protein, partial [Terriglobia bacterium]|nr:helix-turn-helix domain-containing protein [Terriglobia bacterium]
LERGVVVSADTVLRRKDVSAEFGRRVATADDGLRLRPGLTVEQAERRLILETLAFANNNKTRAAGMLGISLKTLHNKVKDYESQPQS